MAKYRNKKVIVDGMTFDSRREYRRWMELRQLETAGEIQNLTRQVKFVLIPTQREQDTIGKRGGVKQGKVIEREVSYIADFVYEEYQHYEKIGKHGEPIFGSRLKIVVEDTKGLRTKDYIIKRKLMLYVHGIRVKEI